ncbi:putative oxidoreductase C2F3.05c [Echria macrotheca]|uniref:Oxidoreductase C2F3.05c n=1 Tax=Echria macrotheca TaxID=438768 RepID=A0AAJ0BL77_9PEZI|nr:putative oxidoreductase C2F3.05c [Echria macrotheca]
MAPLSLSSTTSPKDTKVPIPLLGFGLWQLPGEACLAPARAALAAGYRHLDSAQLYRNEAQVGALLHEIAGSIPRGEIFITTKQGVCGGSPEKTYQLALDSVRRISGDGDNGYVELFLIHTPRGGADARRELWGALEKLYAEGKARLIGVSNYDVEHLEEMRAYAKVWPPHVNQIELHPWSQQREVVKYCEDHGIVVQAYSPLVTGEKDKLEHTVLGRIAAKHSKTPAQVLIRYGLQKGWVVLPKSKTPERIEQNADVFGFELDEEDIVALDGLEEEV